MKNDVYAISDATKRRIQIVTHTYKYLMSRDMTWVNFASLHRGLVYASLGSWLRSSVERDINYSFLGSYPSHYRSEWKFRNSDSCPFHNRSNMLYRLHAAKDWSMNFQRNHFISVFWLWWHTYSDLSQSEWCPEKKNMSITYRKNRALLILNLCSSERMLIFDVIWFPSSIFYSW